MGDHGQAHVRGKQFCYEEGLHIPLIIRWPRVPRPDDSARRGGRPADRGDRPAPTSWHRGRGQARWDAGPGLPRRPCRSAPAYVFGARDRCDETVFRLRTVRDARYRYIRNFTPERPFLQPNEYKERSYPVWNLLKAARRPGQATPAQKALTAPTMPPEELYDLDADPHEIHNLATSDPAHQEALTGCAGCWSVGSRRPTTRVGLRAGRSRRGQGGDPAGGHLEEQGSKPGADPTVTITLDQAGR